MRTHLIRLTLVVAVVAGLASCDDVDADQTAGVATLGTGFQTVFSQGRDKAPVDIDAMNLLLTPTSEPFEP